MDKLLTWDLYISDESQHLITQDIKNDAIRKFSEINAVNCDVCGTDLGLFQYSASTFPVYCGDICSAKYNRRKMANGLKCHGCNKNLDGDYIYQLSPISPIYCGRSCFEENH